MGRVKASARVVGSAALVFVTAFVAACSGEAARDGVDATSASPPTLTLIRTVSVTSDAEGGSARPEIAAAAGRVFVVYLGNIADRSRTFSVKVFDGALDNLIASKAIVATTAEYGGPTDIRVASDGRHLYAFYETHKPISPTTAQTYLWGAAYRLDDGFERVAHTPVPIASSKPMSELPEGGELLDDPAPLLGPDTVFVITRLKASLSTAGRTAYRVREFDKDTLAPLAEFDLDLSGAASGRARVSSLLFRNDSIVMALATTVSNQGVNESSDDGALSDIVLVRMKRDWSFDPRTDVAVLSAQPGDRETYVSGLDTDGRYLYVTHKQAVGSPPWGEQIAWIKVFDRDLRLVFEQKVRSTPWGPGGGEMRPSLVVAGPQILSGQSAGQSLGKGNAEIHVFEWR